MLYIMRHGRTDWNNLHKMQGRTDIPINDEGRRMAEEAGKAYADIDFDVCYSSPLIRAKETAELFFKGRNVPIITDDRLVEMCFGKYEGLENSFSIPDCPINTLFWQPENYVAEEGAESLEQLFDRTGEFIEQVVMPQLAEGKNILIVGHGAMNCSIVCRIKNIPLKNFWDCGIENCKLMKLI
ncbi:MAG: histidine phosphatase family protein [Oscillospiraceae bacterium]|nr:histidine phosphatase family protein [Oscillospiraceae bacterium]